MNWFIFGIVFAIFVSGTAAGLVTMTRRQQRRERYMAVIVRGKGGAAVAGGENRDKQLAKQRADIAKKLKEAGNESEKKKDKTTIRELMQQAGIEAPMSRFWMWSAIFSVVVWIMTTLMTSWPQVAIIFITFTAFLGMPKLYLKKKAARRQNKFLAEFADALEASVRLLQAGMPMTEAIAMVSREFQGPIREEMIRVYENQKIGIPLGAAAMEMARRVPLTEVHMFATALQIQSETGSSLSEILSNLAAVIRARFRLKRRIKALSSEAKASVMILASLPPLVGLGLYLANEKYIGVLFTSTMGHILLGGGVFWMSCGILIMRQMINFKV